MDRSRNRNQRCGYHRDTLEPEPEYAVVDDQEEVLNVCILPARQIVEELEYADRDFPRSSSAQSLSSLSTGNSIFLPRRLPREIPQTTGPAVNRDLKPGRRQTILDKRFTPVPPVHQVNTRAPYNRVILTVCFLHSWFSLFFLPQHSQRSSPSLPPSSLQLENHRPGWTQPCRRGQQKTTKKAMLSSGGLQSPATVSGPPNNHSYSLDLESHEIEIRSHQNLERGPSGRYHHEWPQTKEDFDQHDFVAKEKPQQACCEDWYVGACNRADAEHALHLVNKDGAFLVRDCSINLDSEPLVLSVYHEKKVYNVKIRFIESTSKFVLGTGQRLNDMFDSVADIIKFHTIFPIVLISGRNTPGSKYPENCVLTYSVTRRDIDQLLQ
ncbi:cytokine-dependent hematopoietic cell linker isoform X2 [Paralichthys olivaceus]|uniref:cytokine-dependent hematopoietic cell linker isoform X2 n=1 Tax=Paralichthys olivaceus TaxID=8255 RepID=UPI0037530FE8